ncbi:MAG: hypothetical protein ACOX6O_08155 [Christensenellales bacterium]|jgi:hypothetical protein
MKTRLFAFILALLTALTLTPGISSEEPELMVWLENDQVPAGGQPFFYWQSNGISGPCDISIVADIFEDNGYVQRYYDTIFGAPPSGSSPLYMGADFGKVGRISLSLYQKNLGTLYADPMFFDILGAPKEDYFECDVVLDKPRAEVGEKITAAIKSSGGRQPAEVIEWQIWEYDLDGNDNPIYGDVRNNQCVFSANQSGRVSVNAIYWDKANRRGEASADVFIGEARPTPAPSQDALRARVDMSKRIAQYGDTIAANINVSGGHPPYRIEYQWRLNRYDGPPLEMNEAETGATLYMKIPPHGISIILHITVYDASGDKTMGFGLCELLDRPFE